MIKLIGAERERMNKEMKQREKFHIVRRDKIITELDKLDKQWNKLNKQIDKLDKQWNINLDKMDEINEKMPSLRLLKIIENNKLALIRIKQSPEKCIGKVIRDVSKGFRKEIKSAEAGLMKIKEKLKKK